MFICFSEKLAGFYNILTPVGTIKGETYFAYLSTNKDGHVDYVHKDTSGRQKWRLEPTKDGTFYIMVSGGIASARKYLGGSLPKDIIVDGDSMLTMLTTNGQVSSVDLDYMDDTSGRQKWKLEPLKDGTFYIKNGNMLAKKRDLFLSADDSGNVGLGNKIGHHKWILKHLKYGTYLYQLS